MIRMPAFFHFLDAQGTAPGFFQLHSQERREFLVLGSGGLLELLRLLPNTGRKTRGPKLGTVVFIDARHGSKWLKLSNQSQNESQNNVKRFQCRRCRNTLIFNSALSAFLIHCKRGFK